MPRFNSSLSQSSSRAARQPIDSVHGRSIGQVAAAITCAICLLQSHALRAQTTAEAPIQAEATEASANAVNESKFLRLRKDSDGNPLTLQTSIARYRPTNGDVVVDLIGAVHIGEADYYRQLNKQFQLYDVLLYELVAPQGTRIPTGGRKESTGSPLDMIGWMQTKAQATLGLESQLELVDYQRPNFVHADLSPTQMGEKMAERGDNALTVGLSAMAEMMRQQNRRTKAAKAAGDTSLAQPSPAELMDMLGEPLKLKQMMANQFITAGIMDAGLGKTLNQLLIVDRNAAAMKVLNKQIVNGKKKIGIFYGAAHMPDFERRMAEELDLQPTRHVWLDAWDLTKAGESPLESGTPGLLLKMLKGLSP